MSGGELLMLATARRANVRYEPWVDERAVACHYSVSPRTVRRWRLAGMPSRMLGGQRRFRIGETERWHAERSGA
ncbi:MAG TPA: hypothetical protein VE972_15020 [Conexibacter sp.]|nr:hypothetical protein [Conexibacter sp.]